VLDARSRDAETIFIVRLLVLAAVIGLVPVFVIAGLAKLAAPSYDAGRLAVAVGWPLGFLAVAALAFARRRRT
jgi:uncharacterized membrane protein